MAQYTEQEKQVMRDALNNPNYNDEVALKRDALDRFFERTGRQPTLQEMMMEPEELDKITG